LLPPDQKELSRVAWKILSDSYFTDICLQYPPQPIAASCILLASEVLNTPIQDPSASFPWWSLLSSEICKEDLEGSRFRFKMTISEESRSEFSIITPEPQ